MLVNKPAGLGSDEKAGAIAASQPSGRDTAIHNLLDRMLCHYVLSRSASGSGSVQSIE